MTNTTIFEKNETIHASNKPLGGSSVNSNSNSSSSPRSPPRSTRESRPSRQAIASRKERPNHYRRVILAEPTIDLRPSSGLHLHSVARRPSPLRAGTASWQTRGCTIGCAGGQWRADPTRAQCCVPSACGVIHSSTAVVWSIEVPILVVVHVTIPLLLLWLMPMQHCTSSMGHHVSNSRRSLIVSGPCPCRGSHVQMHSEDDRREKS